MGEGGERLRRRDGHVGEIFYWISFSFSSALIISDRSQDIYNVYAVLLYRLI